MAKGGEIIAGLDIGTTKVCCIVGELGEHDQQRTVDVIGIGKHTSAGLRRGVVVNIDSTVESIKRAVGEAEQMAGCKISSVYLGVAGGHICGFNTQGLVAVQGSEVREPDVERVLHNAKAQKMPMDREILHIIPREYVVDDCDGIKDPVGMSGVRLEAKVHLVTAAKSALDNLRRCAERTNLFIEEIVFEPLASASAVLDQDERELGVALIDIGGGTTDIAIYHGGSIVHSAVVPVGGNHITNDIAQGLRTPRAEAERIKQLHGRASSALLVDNASIEVPSVGGRDPLHHPAQLLVDIIEPRVEELFQLVQGEFLKGNYENLVASGCVITGGASVMPGMVEMAEEVLGMPARVGHPQKVGGLYDVVNNPAYATALGLVLHGATRVAVPRGAVQRTGPGVMARLRDKLSRWFEEVL